LLGKCLLKHIVEGKIGKDRSEGKTRKKIYAATERPSEKERIMEIGRGSARSHCVENWLWEELWS